MAFYLHLGEFAWVYTKCKDKHDALVNNFIDWLIHHSHISFEYRLTLMEDV
jgi:hypothetical protein